jgi:hypothetical protein
MFEMLVSAQGWGVGEVVKLVRDDGSMSPEFEGVTTQNRRYDDNRMFLFVDDDGAQVKKVTTTLRQAKQALADAIHQNGGWNQSIEWNFSTCDRLGVISFWNEKPAMSNYYLRDWCGESRLNLAVIKRLPNWHQCILSRDEYFTAYPEKKVEAEMTSESEMAINASDWHKNGELPPVGVGAQLWLGGSYAYDCEVIAKRGNSYVLWNLTWDRADSADCSMCDFRPLRTERDKAIDELESLLKITCLADHENLDVIAAAIYAAGYRKEVK